MTRSLPSSKSTKFRVPREHGCEKSDRNCSRADNDTGQHAGRLIYTLNKHTRLADNGKLHVNRSPRLPRPIPSLSPASCRPLWASSDPTRCRRRPSAGSKEPRRLAAAPAGYRGVLFSLTHRAKTAFSFLVLND